MPKYYLLKDWNMCSMMFGCTLVSFSHQPSLGAGGFRVPSCSQIDRNPLTAGYCRQGVRVYSKSLTLAVTFNFQSIFFQDSVHFCQFAASLRVRNSLWSAARFRVCQRWPQTGAYKVRYFLTKLKLLTYFQITTYFLEILRLEARY